jgi:hypothetical protein
MLHDDQGNCKSKNPFISTIGSLALTGHHFDTYDTALVIFMYLLFKRLSACHQSHHFYPNFFLHFFVNLWNHYLADYP